MNRADELFLNYIDGWLSRLPELDPGKVFKDPGKTAILSVDMINGFCREGSLASSRIEAVIPADH